MPGVVYLVGAGPGDPGLITRRGADLVARADAVVYDGLASPVLLRLAHPGCELIYAGKKRTAAGAAPLAQEEIHRLLIDRARAGKQVVRLKGGDPFVFGRGAEECEALSAAGIRFEVVPGVSAATAVAAYAGIPLTARGIASTVAYATGHEAGSDSESDGLPSAVDWAGVAAADTVVLFMALSTAADCCARLMAAGRDPSTPAAAIHWGTTASQRTVVAALSDLAGAIRATGLRPPALLVIGDVVRLRQRLSWFEDRPLAGARVLVTRAPEQAERFSRALAELGAEPLDCPVTRIAPPPAEEAARLDAALGRLGQFAWLLLASANAVDCFAAALAARRMDGRALAGVRIACVGPATAAALAAHGLLADLVPPHGDAAGVARAIIDTATAAALAGARVLVPRAEKGRDEAIDLLRAAGAEVEAIAVYRLAPVAADEPAVASALARLRAGEIRAAAFFAPSQVRALCDLLGPDASEVLGAVPILAAIGATTAAALAARGLTAHVVPSAPDAELFAAEIAAAAGLRFQRTSARPGHRLTGDRPMQFPDYRPRRMRRTERLRTMVRETRLAASDFIYPLFVVPGSGVAREIPSMPGQYNYSVDQALDAARAAYDLGVSGVILFGVPERKDAVGSEAWNDKGVVQQTIRGLKKSVPELVVAADGCFCEYTDHGHCGVLIEGQLDNDSSLENLARTALSYARAGVDLVAPSGMLDGFVGACRESLDEEGFSQVAIMAYSAKYASAFYGPFRDAADSAPQEGDRRGYQMDPANAREAVREVGLDVSEGADIVMVKPALPYLDIIRAVADEVDLPLAAYNVSGEYSMLKAAGEKGWIDYDRAVLETLTSIRRAGADIIITYHALEAAKLLR